MSSRKAHKFLLNNLNNKFEIFTWISMTNQQPESRKFKPLQIMISNPSSTSWNKTFMILTKNACISAAPVKISTTSHMHSCSKNFQNKSLFPKYQASYKIYWERLKDGPTINCFQELTVKRRLHQPWGNNTLILLIDWENK
jgi:hypothetical protein